MNKQVTDQTGSASPRRTPGGLSRRGGFSRRAKAHHPTGSPSAYAMIPGTSAEATVFLNAFLFFSPLRSLNSVRFILHHMHQQPPQAPRMPKSCSKSGKRDGVHG